MWIFCFKAQGLAGRAPGSVSGLSWAALCWDSSQSCSELDVEVGRTTVDMGPVDTDRGWTGAWLSKNVLCHVSVDTFPQFLVKIHGILLNYVTDWLVQFVHSCFHRKFLILACFWGAWPKQKLSWSCQASSVSYGNCEMVKLFSCDRKPQMTPETWGRFPCQPGLNNCA